MSLTLAELFVGGLTAPHAPWHLLEKNVRLSAHALLAAAWEVSLQLPSLVEAHGPESVFRAQLFAGQNPHVCFPIQAPSPAVGLVLVLAAQLAGYLPDLRPASAPLSASRQNAQSGLSSTETLMQAGNAYAQAVLGTLPAGAGLPVQSELTPRHKQARVSVPSSVTLLSSERLQHIHARLVQAWSNDREPVLCFSTSGSTGEPQRHWKSGAVLLREVEALRELFFADGLPSASRRIVSFVPPFHIYGFLYTFLLPVRVGAQVVEFADDLLAFPDTLRARAAAATAATAASHTLGHATGAAGSAVVDLLVAVPSLWTAIRRCLGPQVRAVVTSGARLGSEREREYLQLQAKNGFSTRLVEVLGSTETGGMGHRTITPEVAPCEFSCFPGVHTQVLADGRCLLHSPFVFAVQAPPGQEKNQGYALADRLEPNPNGTRFVHAGRVDRVFKYNGRRFSLDEVETHLQAVSGASAALCYFKESPLHPKGGVLLAFLEGLSHTPGLDVRERFLQVTAAPYPEKVYVFSEFPRSALGKVTLSLLEEAVAATTLEQTGNTVSTGLAAGQEGKHSEGHPHARCAHP